MKKIVLICAMMCLLLGPIIGAAEEVKEEIELEEIVVTATRTEKPISEAPASVSVVTKEDIEKRNIQALDNAVNLLPGVFDKRGKGLMDSTPRVTVRGIPSPGGNRTLILMDGLTLNDAYTGGLRWGGLFPENMERIEVVRGPFSSLYGGYAMGGVVNIITKMPEKREFILKGGYGSDDLWSAYASYGDRFMDRLSAFVSYGYKHTNGYPSSLVVRSSVPAGTTGWEPTTDKYGNPRYLVGDRGDNGCWEDSIDFKISYNFTPETKGRFSFMRTRFKYFYDDPETYLLDAAGNPVWSGGGLREDHFLSGDGGNIQNLYNIGLETVVFKDAKLKVSFGVVDVEEDWWVSALRGATRFGGPGEVNETTSNSYQTELQLTFPIFERHLITVGTAYRYDQATSKTHDLLDWTDEDSKTTLKYKCEGKDMTIALFLQGEISILDNLTGYLGLRTDWWKTFDGMINEVGGMGYKKYGSKSEWALSPKLALVYKPFEKTTLRGCVGRAFRPPSVYELYKTWTRWGRTYESNPDLDPEMVTSLDFGVEQGLWKGATFRATYFHNWIKDLIYYKDVSPTLKKRINAGRAESNGVELEMEQRVGDWLRLFANYTYTLAKMKENPAKPATEGKRLTHVPERMANFGGELTYGPLSFMLTGRYVSKQYSDDENRDHFEGVYGSYDPYFVVDTKISYSPFKWATISFSVDNIFDEDYYCHYKAPERTFFGEITLRF
ncbi:MAG: TonB-dependent receptor [Deltaproteobacteria bacterium]|nr:MAG: TonB-dependent receptor [Deltaproteobacteria bacterium]